MEWLAWNSVVVIFWPLKTWHFPNDIANVYSEQPSFPCLHTRSDTPWFLEHYLMTPWPLSNVRYSWLGPFSDSAITSKFLNVSRAKRKKKFFLGFLLKLWEISPGCSLEGLILKQNSNTLATSCEELTHWKRPWCWEGLGAGGEGDNKRWDGWMASPTRWAWVWVNSRSWWWTGRPGVLWFMGLQRVRHDWVTELTDWWEKYGCWAFVFS